jgi:hypothetical protein
MLIDLNVKGRRNFVDKNMNSSHLSHEIFEEQDIETKTEYRHKDLLDNSKAHAHSQRKLVPGQIMNNNRATSSMTISTADLEAALYSIHRVPKPTLRS